MLNRKLLEVIQRLDSVERNRLRQFLQSPFFNATAKSSEILRLYEYIIQHEAAENHPLLEKSIVFRHFFPNTIFEAKSKSPLDSLTTELYHLVRRFLAQMELQRENGEFYEYWAMAKFCRKYGLEDRFWQNIQQARNLQENSSERDAPYFFNQFKIEEEVLNFRGLYNSYEDDVNLYAVQENLDRYYSILKLDFTSALEHQKRFTYLTETSAYLMNEAVMKLSEQGGPFDMPINQIYRLIIRMTQNSGEEQDFDELEYLVKKFRSEISPIKYNNIMAFQRGIWVKRYRQLGQGDVSMRIFEMYRKHLEEGYLYLDNSIMINSFYNLSIIALRVQEFDWVKKFLDNHPAERICGTRFPKDIHSLCLAEYFFAVQKYEEAENSLVYRLFENAIMSISADVLLIKIYYETNNDLLETRMGALYKKVQRSKFAAEKKDVYLNFLRKLDKIIKYGWMDSSPKRLKLIEEIKALPGIASREWLLEKLA